ncbi:antibiotic biosynthesis monooxygenase family protein [Gimesia aquarii]|uniref:Antibiotic biosynthesis monooxygenase n=1 Tax=Gimesia aquarii TaxID=2527964 RepID=A0A517W2B3_9PLAN|nr:antibiotic biosynthesis monooxygenase [Gimesia aquarii]QDT99403.1 Antibiotic biosynthesis monooxygenase [Gimesia aquarii]
MAPKRQPPYYAVIFTSTQTDDLDGYAEMSAHMEKLASNQSGFLGIESFRSLDKKGVTISYWKDLSAIRAWKENPEHLTAQQLGKQQWYQDYTIEIAKIETAYDFQTGCPPSE